MTVLNQLNKTRDQSKPKIMGSVSRVVQLIFKVLGIKLIIYYKIWKK